MNTFLSAKTAIFAAAAFTLTGMMAPSIAAADDHKIKIYIAKDYEPTLTLRPGYTVYKGFPVYRSYNYGNAHVSGQITQQTNADGVVITRGPKTRHTKPQILILK